MGMGLCPTRASRSREPRYNSKIELNRFGNTVCPFCRETVFYPFAGLFISKSCLSPHIKLMNNETKNTLANEWRFDEGCEKSPSAVILASFSGTSSLRNKIHALKL